MTHVVLGLNYGDEGKGLVTAKICDRLMSNQPQYLKSTLAGVVRFSGGHQAGHTVEHDGIRHVFQSIGSGTFLNVPTFWTNKCTFYPTGFVRELQDLKNKKDLKVEILVDSLTPITTPWDVLYNQCIEEFRNSNKHGSVGVGFGTTIERHETTPYRIFAVDMLNIDILTHKLNQVYSYYLNKAHSFLKENNIEPRSTYAFDSLFRADIVKIENVFLEAVEIARDNIRIDKFVCQPYYKYVFEGSQGILLDKDHGYFPHVTRANTTSKNAMEMIAKQKDSVQTVTVNYVTRAYMTRHGVGNFPSECKNPSTWVNVKDETNVNNQWQDSLRIGALDIEAMKYALACDSIYHKNPAYIFKKLWITCVDQLLQDEVMIYENGKNELCSINKLTNKLHFSMSDVELVKSPKIREE